MIENALADARVQARREGDAVGEVQDRYGQDIAVRALDGDYSRLAWSPLIRMVSHEA